MTHQLWILNDFVLKLRWYERNPFLVFTRFSRSTKWIACDATKIRILKNYLIRREIHTNKHSKKALQVVKGYTNTFSYILQRGRLNELQLNVSEAIACYESTLSIHPNHKAAKQRAVSRFFFAIFINSLHSGISLAGSKNSETFERKFFQTCP